MLPPLFGSCFILQAFGPQVVQFGFNFEAMGFHVSHIGICFDVLGPPVEDFGVVGVVLLGCGGLPEIKGTINTPLTPMHIPN